MPLDNSKLKKVYATLQQGGYKQDYNTFLKGFTGNDHYENRKKVYDLLSANGAQIGDSYEDFMKKMQVAPAPKKPTTPTAPAKPTPAKPKETPLTEADRQKMLANVGNMMAETNASIQRTKNRMDYARANAGLRVPRVTIGDKNSGVRLGQNTKVVAKKPQYNPKSGKMEQTYITESGNEYTDRGMADLEQNATDAYKDSMTIGGQLRDAYAERDRLDEAMKKRMKEIDERPNQRFNDFMRESAAAMTPGAGPAGELEARMSKYDNDDEYLQLMAAARKNHQTIQLLEDKKNNQMNSFWHSLGTTALNGYTFTDGMSEMRDATALTRASKHIDSINRKRAAGKPLTREEQTAEAVLKNFATDNAVQGMYGGDYGAWARAGGMTANSLDFMKDLMLNPGAGSMAKGIMRGTAKGMAKGLAKVTGKEAAQLWKNNVVRRTLKATGVLIGAHTAGAYVSNTTGIGRTAATTGTLASGKVGVDDNGNYTVENAMGLLPAFAEAERQQARENGSEMFGEFIPGVGGMVKKGLEKIGLSKLSGAMTNIGNKEWYKQYSRLLESGGYNGLPGEALEEYEGSLFDALTGHAGDAWDDMTNLQNHVDIWLGCATMGALLGSVPMMMQGHHTAQYYRYKHNTDKADNLASFRMTAERWAPLRDKIDNTDNSKMADVVTGIINNPDLHPEEKKAALNYVRNLTMMRGYNIAQVNNASDDEEQRPEVQSVNDSYSKGYETTEPQAMNDAKNLLDMKREQVARDYGIENVGEVDALIGDDPLRYIDEQRQLGNTDKLQSVIDYANAKSAYDGMVQRVRDDIDSRIEESDATVNSRVNRHDGMIHPASLKLQNEDGTDKKAYVVSGNVVMFEDGKGVDKEKSDQTIVIRDVESGEMKVIPPDLIHGMDAAIDPEEEKARAREAIIEEMSQTAANNVDGVVLFNEGDTYTLTDENGRQTQVTLVANEQGLVDNGDGTVNVTVDGQNVVPMSMEAIQSGVDATNMARTKQAEAERKANDGSVPNSEESVQNEGESVPEMSEGVQYGVNDTFTLLDGEGATIHGEVQNISDDGVEIRTDEPLNGKHVQVIPAEEFENSVESINDANGNPVWTREYAEETDATEDASGNSVPQDNDVVTPTAPTTEELVRMARGGNELAQHQLETQGVQWEEPAEEKPTALSHVPLNEKTGEPMFEKADKETALDALNEVTGGNEANTTAIVNAQVEQAQKTLDALKKKQPTKKAPSLKGSPMAMVKAQQEADANYNAAMEQYNAQVANAEETLGAWSRIYTLMNERKRAIREQQEAEQRERDKQMHDAAVAQVEEQKRIAAQKAAEQAEVGTHAVNPKIKAKWDGAAKVEGNPNALTLADGSTIRGHYVLTEAGAASASHDVNNAFEPTEGFPIDENGESVNDRDYKRDTDAQRIVRDIANSYDSRALQSPVIVSKAGVVLSGNNRTMSGDIAAQQGTDKAYIDHLREFGQMYGFTLEQIDGMKHPRVVFVPDEQLPYDATTFARFNAEQQKKQSKPEHAVKLGKIVPDNVFTSITNDISRFDRLSDYYADDKAVSSAISQLLGAGVINEMQLPEMRTGNSLSAAGKELIENTLIGKVFQTSPDAVRHIISTPTLRQSVIMGLNEIAHNRTLAKSGYDLSNELGAAVDLVARAKSAHPDIFKDGMPVSPFGREQGLFDDEYGDSRVTDGTTLLLADILNSGKPSDLRKVLSAYNAQATAPAGGQLDMFTGDVTSKEEILNTINEHFRNATPKEQQALVDAAIAERKRTAEAEAGQRGGNEATEQTEDAVQRSAEPQQPAVAETEPAKQDETPQTEEPNADTIAEAEEQALRNRITETDEEWTEPSANGDIYKQKLLIDGKEVIKVDAPDESKNYPGTYYEVDGKQFGDLQEVVRHLDGAEQPLSAKIKTASADVNTEPTEAQKEAGNYKKGHVQVGTFDITIEQPEGSVRKGTDANGKQWESKMHNTYGYFRGTEGVDGDHIDVFLSNDIDGWNGRKVYVVDQYNPDGTFDEHKVMLGFNDMDEAKSDYLANYEKGWEDGRRIDVSATNLEDFEKWIDSSHRKTKPFAEYAGVKKETVASSPAKTETNQTESKGYSIAPSTYTNKKGKTSDVSLLTFDHDLTADQERAVKEFAKERTGEGRFAPARGWKDRESGGWIFRNKEDARKAAEMVDNADAVADNQPLSISNLRETEEAATHDDTQEDIFEEAERIAKEEQAKRKAEKDAKMVCEAVGNTYTREAVTEDGKPYTETMTILSADGKMVEADMNTIGYGGHYSMPIEKAAEELNDNGWVEQTALVDGATPTLGRYQKAYDDFVDGIENKGMLPDTKALKNKIAQAKRRLTTIEKGAALGIKNDEDLQRHEAAMEDAKQMRDAFQAMLDYVNKRVKENESKPTSEKPKKNPSGNKLVTDERYEELKKRMKAKLRGQMNMGIDPEILAIGTEMAVYHIEKGARKFAEYAKGMIDDLGDEIRPYLKAFYNGARDLPEVEEMGLAKDMTPYDDVRTFDVANFDKQSVSALATAEQVVAEQETAKQAEEAKKQLTAQRNEKRKERNLRDATEEDLEQNPVVYYKGEPHRIFMLKREGEQVGALAFSKPRITGVYLENGKEVQLADLQVEDNDAAENKSVSHDGNSEIHRTFAIAVKNDMLSSLDNGTKPYRSILDLRKRASELGMDVDSDGRTDILLQELVEDGLVRAAREVVQRNGRDSKETYDLICKLYDMQPTIAARSSNRIKMQQYSTPLPMAWNAGHFAMSGKENGKVLEPTAGNGMLVFAVPVQQVHANELDETRLTNLREQGFAEVTQQDATEPFKGGRQYDAVIANPPFGKREAMEYDGKMIGGLDPQITLNALASMKDDGRAAIIIGGNMEYAKNGGLKSMKPFFTYLYDHYNVKGVVDMDGKLYAKQGTTFPTRMILIDGRRSDEERAQSAVYPPVESKAVRKAETFEDLYDIVEEISNSNEKTNGTEILRSQQGQLIPDTGRGTGRSDGKPNREQHPAHDGDGRRHGGHDVEPAPQGGKGVLRGEHREDTGDGTPARGADGDKRGNSGRTGEPVVRGVDGMGVSADGVGLTTRQTENKKTEEPKKRTLTEEKLAYRPHNTAFSLESVAPAAMVEAMDRVLAEIEKKEGSIDEFVTRELGYDTIEDAHNALAAEQMDSVAMAIYQMKQGQAMIIGDQTGVGKGRQMAALIRWAVKRGEKPIFITQKADLFSDIYRDLVDVGSGDLVPFIFNSPTGENKGEMVDANGKVVHKGLSDAKMKKVLATGKLPDNCDYAVLTYSQVNTGDAISQEEAKAAAKKKGGRTKKSKSDGKATPKATFLRAIAKDNYLFLDESHTAAGTSNTGAYLQSILRGAKAATFASATFAKRPDTMPLYAIRTAMSQAKVEPDKMIGIIEKGGVTLQEIMSRELTNAGQMVRRERDMSDVRTDWKTIDDAGTVKRARDNYDRTITAFNAIIKFQEDYVKPLIDNLDQELAVYAESAGIKRGTNKLGVDNVPFASKTYNYTKQLMLALKVDAIVDEVDAEIKAGRHPVIALESTMESSIKDYAAGEVIDEPTFSASLLRGLDSVMQYTIKDENGKESHAYYTPEQLGETGEKAYHDLQQLIRESTSDIFISPLDAIIDRLHEKGYKVGELTGRNSYVERDADGSVVVRRRTDKDKKRMQREFNNGELDVLILNKSASTGISLHASEKFSDQRQRTMIIAQPLSDINDYMQMIGRIDRTGQVHRGYYINLGLPVPAENRFLMMLSTKLKSLNANTTTSQDSESNEVEAPDLLNKYGSQVVVEYLRDNPDVYEKMGAPLKKGSENGKTPVKASELDEYKPQEDDARRITGSVALLSTKEQEDFYDDVVRRYNELMKYLNDTGNNDLKITVMPLRAKTIDKRVSSEGIDPNGSNPFARNSYVEKVEMDVLRKPMKADEVRKTIEQVCKGQQPEDCLRGIVATIKAEDEARMAAEDARYEKALQKAQEDIAKQTEKINGQQKRTAEEKQSAIAAYTSETNERVEAKHGENIRRIKLNQQLLVSKLNMFEVGKSYLVPDNLETQMFDFAAPAIFCGYKAKESKITASTTLAVFATLDGRRRVEVKLSQLEALNSIQRMTNDNWDAARSTTLDNWDSQIPTESRKTGYIMTGNILQAIADTQDEKGGYPGQLISYTDMDGNVHDGILMPDKWNSTMLKTSGAPIISRLQQIKEYKPIVSHDGKVEITGSAWAKTYYLTVPKTKKDGAIYYENKTLLRAAGGNFYPYHGKLRADIPAIDIEEVVKELSKLGVKVREEIQTEEDKTKFRLLEDDDPKTMELEALPDSELVPVYRNVQAFEDDALGSPMAFTDAETGERRTLQGGKWNYSNPPQIQLTDEQQRQLDELNKNGYIMVDGKKTTELQINDGLKFVKPKTKDAQLQYFLKKNPEDKGLWAAYDPYDHAIETPLNTQFGEAYKRPNLVVVRSLIPKSEIDEPFHADYALLPTGAHQWNNGRTLYLSRWSKIDKVLTREEEAKMIDEYWKKNPGKREALKTHRDYNRFVPQVRRELEKMGYRFELDGKELTPEESRALDKQNWESRDVIPGREGHIPFVSNEDIARINAKMAGKWVGEPKEAMENAMTERVNELAESLNTPVRIVRTDDEVAALPSARQRRMKGSFNPLTGEVTIVVPNNANMADIENTFIHEVVGHDGLRVLFPEEEKLNNALDELYRVSKDEIRNTIDRMAQRMYDAEVDRLREKKRKEHEAKGEDSNASYYADMAEAHAEASKKREQFKRDATEEYGADLAGRIGEKGFEKMSAEELTFWGKLKAMLQKALQKLLAGLKIPGKKKLSDKEWAFVLHEAYKRKKNGGNPTVFDAADTEVMRRKTGFDKVMYSDGAIREELDRVNERFNEQLAQFTIDNADKINFNLGNPSAKLLSAGVADKPIRLHGSKVVKKMKKHGFSIEELRDLPKAVANPIAVFDNLGKDGNRSVLTELRTANGNFLVTIDLGKGTEADFDIVSSVFGKKGHSVATWINKGYMRYVDKKKALNYLHLSAPIAEASDNAELSSAAKVVENFENPTTYDEKVEDEGIMFRDGDSVEYNKAMAHDIYEQRVSRGMYQTQEALQDSMLGLKEAMDAILKAEGKGKTYIEDVAGYENAYLGENRLSSVNQAECAAFAQTLFKPMLEEVAKLAKTADERAELTDYMMAKHGLERNEVMARRAAEKQAKEEFRDELRKAERDAAKDPLDQDAADALDDVKQRKHDREEELYFENRSRDYAGLTALTGMDNVLDAEAEAQRMVTDYEAQHNTKDLWDKVNAVTKATLQKTYESGLINKATYDDISGMYKNYIPLRGFDDKTSDEAYAYLADKHSAFNAPIKTAKGRKSKADDPFANMEAMAESAIMQGNRNTLVKQKFLNFALNHPSDLVSVSDLWLWHNDAADEWQPINSGDLQGTEKIEEGDSPTEVERKMRDFEEAMQQAAKSDPAHFKKQKDNPAIPYRVVESRDLRQHQVLVKRNGKDIILTINGNPRAAQALNGQTNPDNDVSGAIGAIMHFGEKVNRQLSAFYTTRNPDFVVSNFMRDMMYANTMVWVKESPNYAWRFHKNVVKVNPAKMKILLAKLRKGTLDMSNETEKMFHLFMMNGGETGYANIRDIEKRKNDIKRELKKYNGQMPVRKAWELLGERLDEYNRAVENCARFAAFMTSRQLGRTIDRSVYDAKEISVNFNKKGSGAKFWKTNGQTGMGNAAAFASGLGRSAYVFWNAAIQGSTNFGRQFKRHPKKAIAGAAAMFLLGALMASIGGDDGDDEGNKDAYYNLPEYVRRSNVVFRLPGMDKSWISMPLPVEYRAMYGMGELMVSAMSGKEHYTTGELAHQMASQVSQMLPIDFMEGGGSFKAFIPSAVKPVAEVITNESWTGMPIYKDTPFNKDMPEWTKAYKSANKYLVGLSKALNEATGGDNYTSGMIDINPAQVEYLLNGIFGGVSSTIDKLTKMGETAIGGREYDPRNFLLLNRLVKNGDERTEYRAVNNEYFRIRTESEKLRKRLNHYENDTADGVFDYADKISWLNNSPEYRILETYEEYSGDIDDINEDLKEASRDGASDKEIQSLEAELNQKKKELVDAVNNIRNGKR